MQQCQRHPFYYSANHELPGAFAPKKYFQISNALPAKYNILWKAIPKQINSHMYQKISLVNSECQLTIRLQEFKKSLPKGKNGKFTCLFFTPSCTFLSEMHYGTPKNSKKYHEICLYSGPIDISKEQVKKIGSQFEFKSSSNLSRRISKPPTDLDDVERYVSEDDELLDPIEKEDPDPTEDFYSEFNNSYEKSMTVQDRNGYNFTVSALPSLNRMEWLVSSGKEINLQSYAQVCGVSNSGYSAIQALFQTIRKSLVSGSFDE